MRYKVIQWASGGMGFPCLRAVLARPELELVGLHVYSQDKVGRDAGDIVRVAPTGVTATNRIEDILRLEADVVIHCARIGTSYRDHDAQICQLLASGKNVISINGHSHPSWWNDEASRRLAAACIAGGSSLMVAGLNPGHVGDQLAVVASGICSRFDSLHVIESASVAAAQNADYVFGALGFGSDPRSTDPNDPDWGPAATVHGMFTEVLAGMAGRLGLPVERISTEHRLYPAGQDVTIRAGVIPRGMTSQITYRWHAHVAGARRLTMEIRWYADTEHLPDPAPPLWELLVQGVPSMRLTADLEKHPRDPSRLAAEQQGVAGSVVNAIPWVVAAPPGLVQRPMATPYAGGLAGLMAG